jgi:hypothetical protein
MSGTELPPEDMTIPCLPWRYAALTKPEHFFRLAQAFLDSANYLYLAMVERRRPANYLQCKAAWTLAEHAVELFLKGGIVQAGRAVPTNHNTDQLYNQFRNLYPGKKFEFDAPVADIVRPSDQTPNNEFSRYPTDRSGELWSSNSHFEPCAELRITVELLQDFERMEPLMKQHRVYVEKK